MKWVNIAAQKLVLAAIFASGPVAAQDEVILFSCLFDWKCDPNTRCEDAALDRRIRLETATNSAEVLGGNPFDKVQVAIGDRTVSFLEHQISGAVDVTTVKLMNGEAVYSTHRVEGVTLTPAQYLGACIGMPASE